MLAITTNLELMQQDLAELSEQLEILKTAQKGYEEIFLTSKANRSDVILLVDKHFAVKYASPSCLPILGHSPQDLIGDSCLEHVHPDDRRYAMDMFFKIVLRDEFAGPAEFRLMHKNGTPVTIEAAGRHLGRYSDSGGSIIHYRNITPQKESERTVLRQKLFYESILNSIYDGVCVTDSGDIITFANRGFSTTMGIPAEAVLGKKILPDILAPGTTFFHDRYARARSSMKPEHFESIPVTTTGGISIFISGWCIPQQADGGFDGMLCTFTNITEQQIIKEKLSESEIRFRSIAETANDCIITVKGSGEVVFWNTAASIIFGYSEAEVLGKDIYRIMPPHIMAEHAQIFAHPENSMHRSSIGMTIEGMARRKDGAIFPIELSLASWMIGSEVCFTAIIRDITQRKHIEQSLHHSEQELKALSSRLLNAHELERKRIAYELHDGLGQMLSAAMIGAKSLISAETPLHSPASPCSLLDNIQAAIEEVRRISRDLRPSILDDLGIIAAIDAFCRDFEQLHGKITVEKAVSCREHEIPERLKIVIYRVIQEACANVVRHSGADMLTVRLFAQTGAIRLHIGDNGAGFDVHTAYTALGRGLGLSSMRERVEHSGGRFFLESQPGCGTTVQADWSRPAMTSEAPGQ